MVIDLNGYLENSLNYSEKIELILFLSLKNTIDFKNEQSNYILSFILKYLWTFFYKYYIIFYIHN